MNNSNLPPASPKPACHDWHCRARRSFGGRGKSQTRILIAGEGGQGVQKLALILADVLLKDGYDLISMPHYGVEMRMGISMAYLRVGKNVFGNPKFSQADILVVMTSRDLQLSKSFASNQTLLINAIDLGQELREKMISIKSLNMLVFGIIVKELAGFNLKIDIGTAKEMIRNRLMQKGNIGDNINAFKMGLEIDKKLYSESLSKVKKIALGPIFREDNKKRHVIFPNLCKGCGLCLGKCPVKALSWSASDPLRCEASRPSRDGSKGRINFISRPIPQVEINKCTACGTCQEICPDCAIRIDQKQ